MEKRTEIPIRRAGSPVACDQISLGLSSEIQSVYLGGEHSVWVPGIGKKSDTEVLRDVLGCRWLVLPSVPGKSHQGTCLIDVGLTS